MLKQLLLTAGAAASLLLTAAEPSISISFDKGVRTDFGGAGESTDGAVPVLITKPAAGKKSSADLLLTDGLSGKAYPVGKLADGTINTLKYNVTPAVKAAGGSVSFWVKPLDWNGTQRGDYRHFFSAKSTYGGHWFFIYKHPDTDTVFLVYGTYSKPPMTIAKSSIKSWKTNEWHHVGATWTKGALILYLDGKPAANVNLKETMPKDFSELYIGEYWNGNPGSSLVDEVRVFNQVLTAEEMAQEFTRLADRIQSSK